MPGPFDNATAPGGLPENDPGFLGGAIQSLFGRTRFQSNRADILQTNEATAAFQREYLSRIERGIDPRTAGFQALNTPAGQNFIATAPDAVAKNVSELTKLFTPPERSLMNVPAGNRLADPGTGQVMLEAEFKPGEPTAAEKLTDAILEAERVGNTREAELLTQQLPRGPDGRLDVMDYLKVLGAGVAVPDANRPQGLEEMNQKQAQIAITLGQTDNPRAPNMNAMILHALGQPQPGLEGVDPKVSEAAVIIRSEMNAKLDPVTAILRMADKDKPGGEAVDLKALFRRANEAQEGKPTKPGPGPQVPASVEATQVPGQDKPLEQMTREELRAIINDNKTGKIKLTPEDNTRANQLFRRLIPGQ